MQQLQQGVTLQNGKYAIVHVLGQGGFGITYLAEQTTLNREVAIKEFFLNALCTRKDFTTVSITEEVEQAGLVERYMKKFIKEALILSRFDNRWGSLLTFIIGLLCNIVSIQWRPEPGAVCIHCWRNNISCILPSVNSRSVSSSS